jgi:cysteinyl-tRNA synthetase
MTSEPHCPLVGLHGGTRTGARDRPAYPPKLAGVSLHLFDTAAREMREFRPLQDGKVGIYICGLTTQAPPHLGHVRFAVAFDVLRRWLTRGHGYDVTLIRNVTDIDDKILAKSAESGEPWYAVSYRNEGETAKALADLGVLPPTYEPRATGHIPEMVALMGTIIEKGHAYPAADGSGDVYFDVRSWPTYGALTKQKIDDMAAAEDADPRGKHDPRDFALWKGHKADEPATASWPTPFGDGRPGWHLECSAMARKYLGDTFDIHGGGVDLRFPHHENELAQSTSAGLGFANYWLHNGWVTMGGEKMSKSLGNSLRVSTVLAEHRPVVVRYYLTAAHYRSMIEYQETSLAEAAAAVERIEGFLHRVDQVRPLADRRGTLPQAFRDAMDDDLNVSGALAVVHDTVRAANTALDDGDLDGAADLAAAVVAMTHILGVNPMDPHWAGASTPGQGDATAALDSLVQAQLAARQSARSARDFAAADAIRDQLTAAGIAIEDTPSGPRWSLSRPADAPVTSASRGIPTDAPAPQPKD